MRPHILVLLPLSLLAAPDLSAADTTVWRIGKFDHASVEFHGREADTPPVIDANSAEAAAHWPARQDGSGNVNAGSKAHARIVRFALKEPSNGVYTLRVAALVGNPRVPHLELDLLAMARIRSGSSVTSIETAALQILFNGRSAAQSARR